MNQGPFKPNILIVSGTLQLLNNIQYCLQVYMNQGPFKPNILIVSGTLQLLNNIQYCL